MSDPLEMIENVFIKKTLWSFEKEYRSVIISPLHRYEDLKIYYPDEVLSEIIFGYMIADDDIRKVLEIIRKNYKNYENIKFYKAIPNRNKFIIEKKHITF